MLLDLFAPIKDDGELCSSWFDLFMASLTSWFLGDESIDFLSFHV